MTDNLPGVFPVAQDDNQNPNPKPDPVFSDDLLKGDELGMDSANQVGGMAKEQLESMPTSFAETAPVVELKEDEKVPEEVESWIEKLEQGEEIKLPQPVSDDDGQVLVQDSGYVDEDVLVLPVTEKQVEEGLNKKVYNSARWLAEWCVRVAKKLGGHVVYRAQQLEEENGQNRTTN